MVPLTGPRRSNSVNWKCLLGGDGAPAAAAPLACSQRFPIEVISVVNNVRRIDQRVESVNLPLYGGQVVGGRSQRGVFSFKFSFLYSLKWSLQAVFGHLSERVLSVCHRQSREAAGRGRPVLPAADQQPL